MVGFLHSPAADGAIKVENVDIKPLVSADTKKIENLCNPELEDVPPSLSDCFLDLDSIGGWFLEGSPELCGDPGMAGLGGGPDFRSCIGELGNPEGYPKAAGDDSIEKAEGNEKSVESVHGGFSGGDGPGGQLRGLGGLIEVQLRKVSLGESSFMNGGDIAKPENEVKVEEVASEECETNSDGDVKSEGGVLSSSSSSASSGGSESSSSGSDDDGDEKKVGDRLEIEEGEIVLSDDVDEMVAWSDNEVGMSGPIISKNELKVLPPVPPINVTLQPHHETLPVGVILSIIGTQVIVEGVEKHNPLNEGSILWVTDSRSPLGIVDEIFGPVKNPYYIVRYNSESEIPAGIEQGTLVSFVQQFADHVLNDKSLYRKGYDASGENDEELSDELEFSDDEKEAEYRRMLKMKKRGTDGPKLVNKRKEKWKQKKQDGNWNHNRGDPMPQTAVSGDMIPVTQEQHLVGPPPITAPLNQETLSFPFGPNRDLAGNQAMVPPFQSQGPNFRPPNGIWNNNGFPLQQQQQNQSMLGLQPNGLPGNGGMLWMQQNGPFQFFQTPVQTNIAFEQQMGPIPGLPFNVNGLGGQANFVGGQMLVPPPWPVASMGQNMLNPSQFGMGLQTQQSSGPMNGGEQVGQRQGPQNGQNPQQSTESLNFGQGRGGGSGGGRKRGHYRGGRGRFGGGRGRFQSRQNG